MYNLVSPGKTDLPDGERVLPNISISPVTYTIHTYTILVGPSVVVQPQLIGLPLGNYITRTDTHGCIFLAHCKIDMCSVRYCTLIH